MNDCRHKRPAKCTGNGFVFRKVVISASLGDDITGQDKPENGAYTNSYVEYEANGAQYMYDSGGIYTKIEGGGGKGVSDFNELENRPKYAGEEMTGDTDIPDFSEDIAAETNARILGDNELRDDIAAEADARAAADTSLSGQIANKQNKLTQAQLDAVNSGIDNAKVGQIATNTTEISNIEEKIPTQASSSNQLADKNFVNSSIATNTAYYISDNGQPFQSLADLEAYSGTLTNNDYAFVIGTDSQGNTVFDRYKYNANTQEWAFEYELNNSSFTAEQWAAINSGITSGDVSKLGDLANIKTIGSNLSLDANGVLSATDTTYTDFVGTDGTDAGTAGLVPAPATGDADKYLKSDGTWGAVQAGPTVVQDIGTSTTNVMSQRATTRMLFVNGSQYKIGIGNVRTDSRVVSGVYLNNDPANGYSFGSSNVAIGAQPINSGSMNVVVGYKAMAVGPSTTSETHKVVIGSNAKAGIATNDSSVRSVAIGSSADASIYSDSIALGSNSKTSRTYELSIGSGAASNGTRFIANVADPTLPQDAATKNYVDNLAISYAALNGSTAPTTATEGQYIGQLYYDTTNEDMYYLKAIDTTTTPATYTWDTIGGGGGGIQNALIIREWS